MSESSQYGNIRASSLTNFEKPERRMCCWPWKTARENNISQESQSRGCLPYLDQIASDIHVRCLLGPVTACCSAVIYSVFLVASVVVLRRHPVSRAD